MRPRARRTRRNTYPLLKRFKRKKNQLTKVHFTPIHSVLFSNMFMLWLGTAPVCLSCCQGAIKTFRALGAVPEYCLPGESSLLENSYHRFELCIELFAVSYTFTRFVRCRRCMRNAFNHVRGRCEHLFVNV